MDDGQHDDDVDDETAPDDEDFRRWLHGPRFHRADFIYRVEIWCCLAPGMEQRWHGSHLRDPTNDDVWVLHEVEWIQDLNDLFLLWARFEFGTAGGIYTRVRFDLERYEWMRGVDHAWEPSEYT